MNMLRCSYSRLNSLRLYAQYDSVVECDDVIFAAGCAMSNAEDLDVTGPSLLDGIYHLIILVLDIPLFESNFLNVAGVIDQLSETACDRESACSRLYYLDGRTLVKRTALALERDWLERLVGVRHVESIETLQRTRNVTVD